MRDLAVRPWLTPERVASPLTERARPKVNWLDQALEGLAAVAKARLKLGFERPSAIVAPTFALEAEIAALSPDALRAAADAMRVRLPRSGFTIANVARVFALVREATRRQLGFAHYPVQLMGGFVMLRGKLAEMATGEGKTITAMLPAVAAALAGIPVHVVTVNDYLAERDAEQLQPIYAALGISIGLVRHGLEPPARRQAYERDVVYCNNKELTFDYLRDSVALGERKERARALVETLIGPEQAPAVVMRGLHFAIIDEADSVLIDEARTPLIISRPTAAGEEDALYCRALDVVREMVAGVDYDISMKDRTVSLREPGREKAELLLDVASPVYRSRRARVSLLQKALSALHLFELDQQYIIDGEGKVQIVDEYTGRVMADRQWEQGLHQLIETKENVKTSGGRETLAQITYQRFFRKYLWIAGMSGTVIEVAREMQGVYGLQIVRIATNRPVRRRECKPRVFRTAEKKWRAVVDDARRVQLEGRPVLIGTRSVRASEEIAGRLAAEGVPHVVLNARQDKEEAALVSLAGEPGRITVATNIAGRGTDIKLADGVSERGGLHVILTEYHDSRRVDRQLFGRAGRQGDRGTVIELTSLDDELFAMMVPWLQGALRRWYRADALPKSVGRALQHLAQGRAQWMQARIRSHTFRSDMKTDKALAFGRKPD